MTLRPAQGGQRFAPGRATTPERRCDLKVLAHAAAIIGLYLAFSFALFLELQVNPLYGNIGLVAIAVLAVFYVYIGFLKK